MKKKIDIFYWSPYLGKVATVKSVINSAISLGKKNFFKVTILDCYGEWKDYEKNFKLNGIETLRLQNYLKFKTNTYGFIKSRFIYFITLLFTYRNLKFFLRKKKPKYLMVHLLTFIPFLLYFFNNFETKLILRISGRPKLNFSRYLLWKLLNKKIYIIFCPTIETKKELKNLKIFGKSKIKFLPDPVLNLNYIKNLKKIKSKKIFDNGKYFLTIGRFTIQKNHKLILDAVSKYRIKDNFLFIGEGELEKELKKRIQQLKLNNQIKILEYQKNIFDYIKNSKGIIISSLWEDPGFVMIEAAFQKKIIISSNCSSGPKEFIKNERAGFLFNSNDTKSLHNAILKFKKSSKNILQKKINCAKYKSLIYKTEHHSELVSKYLIA